MREHIREQAVWVSAVFVMAVLFAFITFKEWRSVKEPPDIRLACANDSDCVSLINECGECPDYTIAVNAKYAIDASESYMVRCGSNIRTCSLPPEGEARCRKNICTIEK